MPGEGLVHELLHRALHERPVTWEGDRGRLGGEVAEGGDRVVAVVAGGRQQLRPARGT